MDIIPKQTIYIKNLFEKIGADGATVASLFCLMPAALREHDQTGLIAPPSWKDCLHTDTYSSPARIRPLGDEPERTGVVRERQRTECKTPSSGSPQSLLCIGLFVRPCALSLLA